MTEPTQKVEAGGLQSQVQPWRIIKTLLQKIQRPVNVVEW